MTEQEKRKKAIEEMLNELEMWFDHEPSWLSSKAKAGEIIGRLGYRKEEEVRKETLKELFKAVKENVFDYGEDAEKGLFLAIDIITLQEVIAEKFGLEVEE